MVAKTGNQRARDGFTLPGDYFTSDEMFDRERQRLFHGGWYCVGRREQLSEAGDYFQETVVGEQLLVTLNQDEQLRAFYNVCRHRGTRLANEPSGRFRNCRIMCPYHRWTYDCDGRLLTAPAMDRQPDFDSEDWPLREVAIGEWAGFLFVNLAEQPVPIQESFGPFWNRLEAWRGAELRIAHREEYELATNWKLVFQNFSECYHCLSVHPGLNDLSPVTSCENDFTEGPFLGGPMQLVKGSMTMSGEMCAPPIRTLDDIDRRRVYYYTLLPSLLLAPHPDFLVAWRIQPRAPDSTRIECYWLFEPETMREPGFDPSGAVQFWDQTNRQDWQICQSSYEGIRSRAYMPGPWSPDESVPRAFDREIVRILEA